MKKKKIPTAVKFELALIRGGVCVWYIDAELMKARYSEINFECDGKTIKQDGFNPVIWINPKTTCNKVAILAHEAVHAVSYLCQERDIGYDEELYAYGVQYIVERTLRRMPHLYTLKSK